MSNHADSGLSGTAVNSGAVLAGGSASALVETDASGNITTEVLGLLRYTCLGRLLSANMNVTTDQAIAIGASRYVVKEILVANTSLSLTTAAGGVYSATSKGGSALVAAAQVYTALTGATKFLDLTLTALVGTDVRTEANLYLSLTLGQGAAATADIYVFGLRLS